MCSYSSRTGGTAPHLPDVQLDTRGGSVYPAVTRLLSPLAILVSRVPNSPTGQVLEAGPDLPVLVDVDDWTRLTWVIRSGLDWSQTGLHKRLHESRSGTRASAHWE